jgi:hypothetical protein
MPPCVRFVLLPVGKNFMILGLLLPTFFGQKHVFRQYFGDENGWKYTRWRWRVVGHKVVPSAPLTYPVPLRDIWHTRYDIWHMTYDIWHMRHDINAQLRRLQLWNCLIVSLIVLAQSFNLCQYLYALRPMYELRTMTYDLCTNHVCMCACVHVSLKRLLFSLFGM